MAAMAPAYLIANVGTTDVAVDLGEPGAPRFVPLAKGRDLAPAISAALGCEETGTRAWAAHLRATLDAWRSKVRFPKVVPALEEALRTSPVIECVYLAGTDQEHQRHRLWDSVESVALMCECLPVDYSARVRRFEVVRVEQDVSRHDNASEEVAKILARIPDDPPPMVYVSIKGGIPGLSGALLQHVLSRFPDAVAIEVDEPDREAQARGCGGPARRVRTWPLRRDRVLRLTDTLLERFDYEGVRLVLSAEAVHDAQCHAVLAHAHARLNLDFEGAARALKPLAGEEPFAAWCASMTDRQALQRVRDVAVAAGVRLATADYSAFLTNGSTFVEQAWRHAILHTVGPWIDEEITARQLVQQPELRRALAKRFRPAESWKAGSKVLHTVLRWWVDSSGDRTDRMPLVRRLLTTLERLGKIERRRNLLVHRALGSGLSAVERALPGARQAFPQIVASILQDLEHLQRLTLGGSGPLTSDVHGEIHVFIRRRIADWAPPEEELSPIGTAGDAAAT